VNTNKKLAAAVDAQSDGCKVADIVEVIKN